MIALISIAIWLVLPVQAHDESCRDPGVLARALRAVQHWADTKLQYEKSVTRLEGAGTEVMWSEASDIHYAGWVATCPSKQVCEDAVLVLKTSERTVLLSVDGIGGVKGGDIASAAVARSVREYVSAHSSLEQGLTHAAHAILDDVQRHEHVDPRMGAVATGVEIQGSRIRFVNAGDSKSIQIRNGKLLFATHDHSVVQENIDRGALTPKEAMNDPQRNLITRMITSMGVTDSHGNVVGPDTMEGPILPGDRVVLASDGLWDNLMPEEVARIVSNAPSPRGAIHALQDALETIKKKHAYRGRDQYPKIDDVNVLVYEHQ